MQGSEGTETTVLKIHMYILRHAPVTMQVAVFMIRKASVVEQAQDS
jgi:hypothetical protein